MTSFQLKNIVINENVFYLDNSVTIAGTEDTIYKDSQSTQRGSTDTNINIHPVPLGLFHAPHACVCLSLLLSHDSQETLIKMSTTQVAHIILI